MVIHDSEPVAFKVCIALFIVTLVAFFILTTILDIRRAQKRLNQVNGSAPGLFDGIPTPVLDILRVAVPTITVFVILRFIICTESVMSGSMEPKLVVGNTAAFNRLAYMVSEPERSDIIMFWSVEQGCYMAKRVIGVPGDEVSFADGRVVINGMQVDESEYIENGMMTLCDRAFTVPDRAVFVLGDDREDSYDSRFWGDAYVSYGDIIGKYMGQVTINVRY